MSRSKDDLRCRVCGSVLKPLGANKPWRAGLRWLKGGSMPDFRFQQCLRCHPTGDHRISVGLALKPSVR